MSHEFTISPRASQFTAEPSIVYDLMVRDTSIPFSNYVVIGVDFQTQRAASDFASVWLRAKEAAVITFNEKDLRR